MPKKTVSPAVASAPDPRLEQIVQGAMLLAVALVLLLPDARTHGPLGWMPLWLLGMPAVAWWSLHRFRLPGLASPPMPVRRPGRRRAIVAPRRREAMVAVRRVPRAA